jgi:hypothetical protein
LFASFSFDRAGADLTHLRGDGPAAPGRILAKRAILHRESLLIVGGNARVQAGAKHFLLTSSLAENVSGFRLAGGPFYRHFRM